jgi:hypothetical protein
MARQETVLRVFVAFSSELSDEVEAIKSAIQEINSVTGSQLERRLELVTWRNSVMPGVGPDPQAVINEQIGDNYDIFIGALWKRFGTPTPRAGSGTEEEFERAYSRHRADPGSVRVMVYFKRSLVDIDQIDVKQFEAVSAFRTKLGSKGVLYWTFNRPFKVCRVSLHRSTVPSDRPSRSNQRF